MTSTNQPKWEFQGHIGDVDPIAYGGGFVYIDVTGAYAPEMTYFEPGPDELWDKMGDETPLQAYRILIENDPSCEWWYESLGRVAVFTGMSVEYLQNMATDESVITRALLYSFLIQYFGADEFDTNPETMTELEAYNKFAQEMREIRSAR